MISGPLKWHGGKSYLANRIVAMMPPHLHYVEPYFGGGTVLLAKDPEGHSEVANDLDKRLTLFWEVLRDPNLFDHFQGMLQATPFSEVEYARACGMQEEVCDRPMTDKGKIWAAWSFFVVCRQSMAGRMKCFSPLTRARLRRGMNEQASAWLSVVDGLADVHARLRRVVILNRPALDVISSEDTKETLYYLDPPYMHETRGGHTPSDYAHEMTNEQHRELLERLCSLEGKFMLSGYPSDLYDEYAKQQGWWRCDFDMPNHASHSREKRRMTERLWCNFNERDIHASPAGLF